MIDYFAYTETALIFLLMGAFSVIMQINKEEKEVKFSKVFQKFYMNVIAGWGIYSAMIGYEEWFGNYPQKIFVIMTVTLMGVKAFDYLEANDVLGRIIESIFQKKV